MRDVAWFQMCPDAHYLLELMNNLQSTYGDSRGDQYTVYYPVKGSATTTTTTTTTTTNVRIIVLPSRSCGGTLQKLYLKLSYSSMQTSADRQSGQCQVSRMTDDKR